MGRSANVRFLKPDRGSKVLKTFGSLQGSRIGVSVFRNEHFPLNPGTSCASGRKCDLSYFPETCAQMIPLWVEKTRTHCPVDRAGSKDYTKCTLDLSVPNEWETPLLPWSSYRAKWLGWSTIGPSRSQNGSTSLWKTGFAFSDRDIKLCSRV